MRNYESRFRLPSGKWAYIQVDALADHACHHIRLIRRAWKPPEHFFHYRKGGHVAALRCHLGNRRFGKIDLSGFFHNVTRHRITRCLKRLGYSFRDAEDFAVASTVCIDQEPRRFALPYGFVQSPLLASVALDKSELGNCLRRIHAGNCTLSVYVDDIIVSAQTDEIIEKALIEIRSAANMSRFPINEEKSRGPSASLRAFNIDFVTQAMSISDERYEAMCREVFAHGASEVSEGIFGYVQSVSAVQAERLLRDFPQAFPEAPR